MYTWSSAPTLFLQEQNKNKSRNAAVPKIVSFLIFDLFADTAVRKYLLGDLPRTPRTPQYGGDLASKYLMCVLLLELLPKTNFCWTNLLNLEVFIVDNTSFPEARSGP